MGLNVEMRDYSLGLVSPLRTAHGVVNRRDGVLFSVSDGLHRGWGEAAPIPGWARETLVDCRRVLESTVSLLGECASVDDLGVEAILTGLASHPHARAAVAGAVLDLTAQARCVSLASLLSGLMPVANAGLLAAAASGAAAASPESMSVHGLISAIEPERVAAAAAELVAEGVRAIKVKVAALDPGADLARVAAARSAIGDDVELRLDANGGWEVDTAVATLRRMAEHDVAFCEEPVSGIDGIVAVGSAAPVPVAVDESAATVADVAVALRTGAIRTLIVKPQALGGPDLAMSAIALIEESGAQGIVTTMIDSAVGVAHAAHVAAAALPRQIHGLRTSHLLKEDVAPRPRIEAGRLHLPHAPGLGVAPA